MQSFGGALDKTAIYDEEARRARVRLCVARFKEARLDLIASEQLQLGL